MTKTEFILMGKRLASLYKQYGEKTELFPYYPSDIANFFENAITEETIRGFLFLCNPKYRVIKQAGMGFEVRSQGLEEILNDMREKFREKFKNS